MSNNAVIDQFIALIKINYNVNYSDKNSVNESNAAIDKAKKIVAKLATTSEGLMMLENLLEVSDYDVKYYVAFDILYLNSTNEVKTKCIELIQSRADTENNFAYKLWLKKYYEDKKNEML